MAGAIFIVLIVLIWVMVEVLHHYLVSVGGVDRMSSCIEREKRRKEYGKVATSARAKVLTLKSSEPS